MPSGIDVATSVDSGVAIVTSGWVVVALADADADADGAGRLACAMTPVSPITAVAASPVAATRLPAAA